MSDRPLTLFLCDFGRRGNALDRARLGPVGAGADVDSARRSAIVAVGGGRRVLVSAFGSPSSGIPPTWAAGDRRAGVDLVGDLTDAAADEVADRLASARQPGDLVVASVHWGSNWGYAIPAEQVHFAHRLVDAGVDVVHGHSSHHPRPLEVYRGRLILYGCGDLIDDYEGIGCYESFRPDLRLLYLPRIDPDDGSLADLRMVPLQARRMSLRVASAADARWMAATLTRAGRAFGTRVGVDSAAWLTLE